MYQRGGQRGRALIFCARWPPNDSQPQRNRRRGQTGLEAGALPQQLSVQRCRRPIALAFPTRLDSGICTRLPEKNRESRMQARSSTMQPINGPQHAGHISRTGGAPQSLPQARNEPARPIDRPPAATQPNKLELIQNIQGVEIDRRLRRVAENL
jgi:hypothetical protein